MTPARRARGRASIPDRERELAVHWSAEAEFDLHEIVRYLLHASPAAARSVLKRLRTAVNALQRFPRRGRVVPELQRLGIEEWRELVIRPYRVIYTVERDSVEIDAVLDSRRDVEALLHRRLVREPGTETR